MQTRLPDPNGVKAAFAAWDVVQLPPGSHRSWSNLLCCQSMKLTEYLDLYSLFRVSVNLRIPMHRVTLSRDLSTLWKIVPA